MVIEGFLKCFKIIFIFFIRNKFKMVRVMIMKVVLFWWCYFDMVLNMEDNVNVIILIDCRDIW